MSGGGSFIFTPTALRSLQLDEDMLEDVTLNLIIEPHGGDMHGLARGEAADHPAPHNSRPIFVDCLRNLLQHGANVDLAPGVTTALHKACQNCQTQCVKLLLSSHGANSNTVSEDWPVPLHVCTSPEPLECAKHLLQFGAAINGQSLDEDDTPLHTAARNGLLGHIELYLRYSAAVEMQNEDCLMPLNAACSQPQEKDDLEHYTKVCELLLGAGADATTGD
ncbi:hypothetical protein J4Q44_G00188840 [Coregonus suidteri]|uniref:Uncharacterized protein n=1 Tax=Coregonus suidteri TaxID=861788 RepID=A0AAN8LJI9_9TELE